jgi:hypothetical protein
MHWHVRRVVLLTLTDVSAGCSVFLSGGLFFLQNTGLLCAVLACASAPPGVLLFHTVRKPPSFKGLVLLFLFQLSSKS